MLRAYPSPESLPSPSPPPEERAEALPLSVDQIVWEIYSFYDFLVHMFIPAEVVHYPPEQGWPELADKYVSECGKSPKVVELLRRLPQIKVGSGLEDTYHVWRYTRPVQYVSLDPDFLEKNPNFRASLKKFDGDLDLPPDMVTLFDNDDDIGYVVILDMNRSIVCFFQPVGCGEYATEYSEETSLQHLKQEHAWKAAAAWPVAEFFERLKRGFREYDQVPLTERGMPMGSIIHQNHESKYHLILTAKAIYRKNGWPHIHHYDKDKCMRALRELPLPEEWDEVDSS